MSSEDGQILENKYYELDVLQNSSVSLEKFLFQ